MPLPVNKYRKALVEYQTAIANSDMLEAQIQAATEAIEEAREKHKYVSTIGDWSAYIDIDQDLDLQCIRFEGEPLFLTEVDFDSFCQWVLESTAKAAKARKVS